MASASGTVRYGPRCLIATEVRKSNELEDKKRVGRAPLVRRNERRSNETTVEWPFSSLIEGLRLRTIADCPRSAKCGPEVRRNVDTTVDAARLEARATFPSASGPVRDDPKRLIATGVRKTNELLDKKRVGPAPLVIKRNHCGMAIFMAIIADCLHLPGRVRGALRRELRSARLRAVWRIAPALSP